MKASPGKLTVGFLFLLIWHCSLAQAEILGFDEAKAVAANGAIPGANGNPEATALAVCGSSTESYLAELIDTPPQQVKVIDHWADIVAGKEMMVSGVVHGVSLGGTDLPFDHPFSSDLNFSIELDPPFQALVKQLGAGADPDDVYQIRARGIPWLHAELELGQVPHDPDLILHGPATGQPWDILPSAPPQNSLNASSHIGLRGEYVPQEGDRIAVMGRWILDCGHASFHSELHPITFMAFGHTEDSKTVVHMFGNPYRSSQRYTSNLGGAGANLLSSSGRSGLPFPAALEAQVLRLVLESRDHLEAPVLLEATRPQPVEWKVCAPAGSSGRRLHIASNFVRRPRTLVRVQAAQDEQGAVRCAKVTTRVSGSYVPQDPPLRQCTMPWDWLNVQAAIEGGFAGDFDLRPFVKEAIDNGVPTGVFSPEWIAAAKARVDNTPTSVCFDPLAAPQPSDLPASTRRRRHRVAIRSDQPFPFYGTIEVSMGD